MSHIYEEEDQQRSHFLSCILYLTFYCPFPLHDSRLFKTKLCPLSSSKSRSKTNCREKLLPHLEWTYSRVKTLGMISFRVFLNWRISVCGLTLERQSIFNWCLSGMFSQSFFEKSLHLHFFPSRYSLSVVVLKNIWWTSSFRRRWSWVTGLSQNQYTCWAQV